MDDFQIGQRRILIDGTGVRVLKVNRSRDTGNAITCLVQDRDVAYCIDVRAIRPMPKNPIPLARDFDWCVTWAECLWRPYMRPIVRLRDW